MKDLYIKPEVELKQFDHLDVIVCSPQEETTAKSGSSVEDGWTNIF